eukprot:g11151.t1
MANLDRRHERRPTLAAFAASLCGVVLLTLGRCPTFALLTGALDGRGKVQMSTDTRVATRAYYTTAPNMFNVVQTHLAREDLMTIKQRHLVPSAEHLGYAVVEYSGRQHMVVEGGMYETYFIRAVSGSKVRLNRVLLLKQKSGDTFEVSVGQPLVDGAYVEITILEHLKGEDQIVFKHKKKMLGLVEDTRDRQTAHQNFNSCDPH